MKALVPVVTGVASAGVLFAHEAFTRHFEPAKRERAIDLVTTQMTTVGIGVGVIASAIAWKSGGPKAALQAALGGAAMVVGAQVGRILTNSVHHGAATTPLIPPAFELGKKTNFVGSRALENAIAGVPLGAAILHPTIGWKWGAAVGAVASAGLALVAFHDDFDKKTVDV